MKSAGGYEYKFVGAVMAKSLMTKRIVLPFCFLFSTFFCQLRGQYFSRHYIIFTQPMKTRFVTVFFKPQQIRLAIFVGEKLSSLRLLRWVT